MILSLFFFCLMRIVTAMEIDKATTSEELEQTFRTSNIENLPDNEREATTFPRRRKRSTASSIYLKAFGSEINKLLNPIDGVLAGYDTPIYLASFDGTQTRLHNYNEGKDLLQTVIKRMYEDAERSASSIITEEENNAKRIRAARVEEKKSVAKPVAKRSRQTLNRHRRSIDGISKSLYDKHNHSIFYEIPESSNSSSQWDIPAETVKLRRTKRGALNRIPDVIYPEILVVVDNYLYKQIGGNIWDALPYLLIFWSSVDLKFRTLDKPKFKLNIAGFVIDTDGKALSYMSNNSFSGDKVIVNEALEASKTFWYEMGEQIPVDKYDVLVTMTANTLCSDKTSCGILGLAARSAACRIDHDYRIMQKVAMVSDDGVYSGVMTAAHELGHSFGAHHDNEVKNVGRCHDEHKSAIMLSQQTPSKDGQTIEFSTCSKRDFQIFFMEQKTECLYNKPKLQKVLPRYLPGMFMNADEQCKKHYGTKICSHQPEGGFCGILFCHNPNPKVGCWVYQRGAVDGTPCGEGRFCLYNKCVDRRTLHSRNETTDEKQHPHEVLHV